MIDTKEGTKYTVIDINGKMMFEPKLGKECNSLAENRFKIVHFDENDEEVIDVIDEMGNIVFGAKSSITNFTNGYAIKDGENYIRKDGTKLNIYIFE